MTALFACGPDAYHPPDASSRWGNVADASPDDPDAGARDADGAPGDPDAGGTSQPDAAPTGCGRDPEGDTEATAQVLPEITDCDNEGTIVSGSLDGADDVDFFLIPTRDTSFCLENPGMSSDSPFEMCLFLDCPGLSIECDQGTPAQSPAGFQGCCGVGAIEINSDCSGATDEPDFYVAVSGAEAGQCPFYNIEVHY